MKKYFRKFLSMTILVFFLVNMVFPILLNNTYATSTGSNGVGYYVDSINGSDNNNGNSSATAWRNISKLNNIIFNPGDRIYLKANSVWNSQAIVPLEGSNGSASSPIIIDMYGEGNKPIINGHMDVEASISLKNIQYIEINNIEITNDNDFKVEAKLGTYVGILYVSMDQSSTMNHIYIRNCNIHDVDGDADAWAVADKTSGGIGFRVINYNSTTQPFYNDVIIENNIIRKVDRTGIFIGGASGGTQFVDYNTTNMDAVNVTAYATNITVKNNYLDDIGGDGVVLTYVVNATIQNNTLYYAGHRQNTESDSVKMQQYNAGIWGWYVRDSIFEFNEAAYNQKDNEVMKKNGPRDGMAWDFDWGTKNVIYQYNYSHSNLGGTVLYMNHAHGPNYFRYNIAYNDESGIGGLGIGYNNTFVNSVGKYYGRDVTNNIFYVKPGNTIGIYTSPDQPTTVHNNNLYYNDSIPENGSLYVDPQLINANPSTEDGLSVADNFKLDDTSPAIDSALTIENNGGRDFFGNSLYYGSSDYGAHENQSPATTTLNDNNSNITYVGNWAKSPNVNSFKGDYKSSNTLNSYYTVSFTGRQAKIYGQTNDYSGMADVYVDGVKKATIDTYSKTMKYNQLYFDTGLLSNGDHTVKIVVLRQKNNLAKEYYIECDKVITSTVANLNDNDSSIVYSSGFATNNLIGTFNSDFHSSNVSNSYYTVSFTGTEAKIYGQKNDYSGMADVYVDGVKVATIDNYAEKMKFEQLYFDTGILESGSHTVKIVVLNQKNSSAKDYFIECDRVVIK